MKTKIFIFTVIIIAVVLVFGFSFFNSNKNEKVEGSSEITESEYQEQEVEDSIESVKEIKKDDWAGYSFEKIYFMYPINDGYAVSKGKQTDFTYNEFANISISNGEWPTGNIFHFYVFKEESDVEKFLTFYREELPDQKKIGDFNYRVFRNIGMGDGYGYIMKFEEYYYVFESVTGPENNLFEEIMKTVDSNAKIEFLHNIISNFGLETHGQGADYVSFSDGSEESYTISIQPFQSAEDILKEAKESIVNPMDSSIKKVGNYDTVSYIHGGYCEYRITEVIGNKNNIRLSTMGCWKTREEDFLFFEKIVETIPEF